MNAGQRGLCLGTDLVLLTDGQQQSNAENGRHIGHEYLVCIKDYVSKCFYS